MIFVIGKINMSPEHFFHLLQYERELPAKKVVSRRKIIGLEQIERGQNIFPYHDIVDRRIAAIVETGEPEAEQTFVLKYSGGKFFPLLVHYQELSQGVFKEVGKKLAKKISFFFIGPGEKKSEKENRKYPAIVGAVDITIAIQLPLSKELREFFPNAFSVDFFDAEVGDTIAKELLNEKNRVLYVLTTYVDNIHDGEILFYKFKQQCIPEIVVLFALIDKD